MKKGELQIQELKGEILQVNEDEKTLSAIAKIYGWEYGENKAFATELVRRWNAFEKGGSHEALVEACRQVRAYLIRWPDAKHRPYIDILAKAAIAAGKKLEK